MSEQDKKFKPVSPKVEFPVLEEEILQYWKENKIFEKSIQSRPKEKTWTFLDGPPFITGLPHYGHLLGSTHKDVFGRFWTMKGYRVRRVWGWDGHGLPIENKVETKLQVKSKKEIEEKVGVKKFIDECKQYVSEVSAEWEWYIDHIGRWVDFKNAYKTWDTSYMESVLWVFKQMYEKKLIYKGFKVSLYCPHCSTPISNFEVAMDADNYKEITDAATTYKYPLEGEKDTFILAWSTTPWNKIVTPALAVNPKLTYVKVKQGSEVYILAKATIKILNQDPSYEIIKELKGSSLVGKKYVPHYDYYPVESGEKAFIIIPGDFVTAEEGTGVVTIAAYGEDDLKAMQEHNIHIEMHLDEEGTIRPDVPLFGGMYYLKANKVVNEDLMKRNLIYKDEDLSHNVPLCWRCHTRLYYAPIDAWYVDVQQLKPLMKKTNEEINWFPEHFKYGRFLKSMEFAPDWNISRNRYWGSPVPVWECECGERFVPGSIAELEEKSGQKIADLHKPDIDNVTITCDTCGKKVKRVPEVLDSWIEAGSASFAERHFPFAFLKEEGILKQVQDDPALRTELDRFFPPDFVAEYTGQIRAWFYVLHVIGAALYESPAFKNVGVEGVILGTDGRKMSKNLGNYPDPKVLLQKYGGDALRLYLMGSPVMHGEDIVISEEQYRNQVKGTMLILWNVYNFFVGYANIDGWDKKQVKEDISANALDTWIFSLLQLLIMNVTKALEHYDTVAYVASLQKFVDEFSTWYIRRSRKRVGPAATDALDKEAFYSTTYRVLTTLSKLFAPITPFVSEEIYRNLTKEESVHLTNWPFPKEALIDRDVTGDMQQVRLLVERGHAIRKENNIKVRQPLSEIWISGFTSVEEKRWKNYEEMIKEELNIKKITYGFYKDVVNDKTKVEFAEGAFIDLTITQALAAEGQARDIIRKIQEERKKLGTAIDGKVDVVLPEWPKAFEEEIKKKALAQNLIQGAEFTVTPL